MSGPRTDRAPKPIQAGDLVILIRSACKNEGAIGTAIRFVGSDPVAYGCTWNAGDGPSWMVSWDRPRPSLLGGVYAESPAPESWLRRIPPASELEIESERLTA